jgi:hypothetical protein
VVVDEIGYSKKKEQIEKFYKMNFRIEKAFSQIIDFQVKRLRSLFCLSMKPISKMHGLNYLPF